MEFVDITRDVEASLSESEDEGADTLCCGNDNAEIFIHCGPEGVSDVPAGAGSR